MKYMGVFLLVFLTACSHLRTRKDIEAEKQGAATEETEVVQPPKYEVPTIPSQTPETSETSSPIPAMPKIGLILGPGGARAYGHIGFLQNLSRIKVPVHATVGIEWGAPVAALLSSKGQVYDVEWQMFKLKEGDFVKKSLIGSASKGNEVTVLKEFFQQAFSNQKAEDFKYPFACPAYNIPKNQIYMMSRGTLENLMPYCLPYPPNFKAFRRNVSAVREVKMAADYLRSQGANYILLVNVLGKDAGRKSLVRDVESTESVIWSEIASFYSKPVAGVDAVIPVELDSYTVTDFDKKREIMRKGSETSKRPVEIWARKLGF